MLGDADRKQLAQIKAHIDKVDKCRHLLPDPGPKVVGECVETIRGLVKRVEALADLLRNLPHLEQKVRDLRDLCEEAASFMDTVEFKAGTNAEELHRTLIAAAGHYVIDWDQHRKARYRQAPEVAPAPIRAAAAAFVAIWDRLPENLRAVFRDFDEPIEEHIEEVRAALGAARAGQPGASPGAEVKP